MIGRTRPKETGRTGVTRLFGSARKPGNPMDGVLDGESFRRLLERERANADRRRAPFATLVFSWPDAVSEEDVASAVGSIRARIRDIDVLGWVRRRQIGLVLPGARTEDALAVAKDLYARFEPGISRPQGAVYPYPSLAECA